MKDLKIIGITVSITFLMIIVLAIFIKAIGILFNSWFISNAMVITIVSGSIILIGVITGAISLTAMASKGRGLFG